MRRLVAGADLVLAGAAARAPAAAACSRAAGRAGWTRTFSARRDRGYPQPGAYLQRPAVRPLQDTEGLQPPFV
jgi:hypothetical protein